MRDVGRQLPALRPRMQAVVSNVEEVQFGGSAPTESRFRSVMLDVVGLLGERLAACVPFIVAVGLAGLLAGCGDDRDSWEHSTSGRVLVVDLLKRYGFTARERLAAAVQARRVRVLAAVAARHPRRRTRTGRRSRSGSAKGER